MGERPMPWQSTVAGSGMRSYNRVHGRMRKKESGPELP